MKLRSKCLKSMRQPAFKLQALAGITAITRNPASMTPSFARDDRPDITQRLAEKLKAYEAKIKGKGKNKRKRKRHNIQESPVFGFDTEYQRDPRDENKNIILAYSYCIRHQGRECSGVFKVKVFNERGRMRFDKFFVKAIEAAIEAGVLEAWPEHVVMAAFMISADLFSFAGAFKDFKTRLQGVRKSVVTIKKDYAVDIDAVYKRNLDFDEQRLRDKNRNLRQVDVSFYDLLLLCPAGFNLAAVGELVGLSKIDIPEPYSIERMIEFMREAPEKFDEYSIRDSEIAALYMERIIEFCCVELGFKSVPYTIGGLGVKRFTNLLEGDFNEVFGFEEIKQTVWSHKKAKPVTLKSTVTTLLRSIFEQFATEGYHGGRNECFVNGLSEEGIWRDYDAPSCYTVILNMLRPIDYGSLRTTEDINEFRGDRFGIAYVRFKHPDDCHIPTLPVHAGNRGLLYVKEGVTVCGAPEIEVALNAGVEIELIKGVVGEWVDADNRIFLPFMQEVRAQRNLYVSGSFEERMWKEIGNSLYGKLAQGLRKRAVFDSISGLSKQIPQSKITNPFYAMHVTSTARALMTEMMLGVSTDHTIACITTDGFVTTADIDKGEIDLSGPVCQRFRDCYHMIESSDKEILTKKHAAKRAIFIKTRGNDTVEKIEGEKAFQARAGVVLDKKVNDKHQAFQDLYFNRKPGQKVTFKHIIPKRDMFINEYDHVTRYSTERLNLEWDCKRLLVNAKEVTNGTRTHVFCESVPHQTVEEAMVMRTRFDGWRVNNCLKTLTDWAEWEDYFATTTLTIPQGIRYRYLKDASGKYLTTEDGQKIGEGSDGILRRLFIRAFMQGFCNLDNTSMERKALAQWLSFYGYETSEAEVRNGGRGLFVEYAVPVTAKTVKLLRLLLKGFPQFDFETLFEPDQVDELYRRLGSL